MRACLHPYRLPTHAMMEKASWSDACRYLSWMEREVQYHLDRAKNPVRRKALRQTLKRVQQRAEEYGIYL